MPRIALGMLCFSRPIHTALTIGFAMTNKSDDTDFFLFYGIHKNQEPPSKGMDAMLKDLQANYGVPFHYMMDDKPRNVQGNVDTLMLTLSSMPGYACYAKIDDDVLIGRDADVVMANIIIAMEQERCYMLMGQAVPEHMRRSAPFSWEAKVNGHRVVQRAQRACPMETMTFMSTKCLPFLRERGMDVSCENARGTYGPYTRKITNAGARVCLVLVPAINMQHIGLTTTIEAGNPARSWAPARSWEPMNQVIQVECFDFEAWEASHVTNTQKDVALSSLRLLKAKALPKAAAVLDCLMHHVEQCTEAMAKTKVAAMPLIIPERPRTPPGQVLRKLPDGRVVRSPGPVHRLVMRAMQ